METPCINFSCCYLRIFWELVLAFPFTRKKKKNLLIISHLLFQTKRNAIIFGDIADRANANNMLTRNASLDESLDNMKQPLKPRKSVTFKDCWVCISYSHQKPTLILNPSNFKKRENEIVLITYLPTYLDTCQMNIEKEKKNNFSKYLLNHTPIRDEIIIDFTAK